MDQIAFDFCWAVPAEPTSEPPPETVAVTQHQPISSTADVRNLAAEDVDLQEGRRRDLLSGLTRFAKIAGCPLNEIPATASAVRAVFAEASSVRHGLTKKSIQTIRSSVAFALKRYGPVSPRGGCTVKQHWNAEWEALIGRIQIPFQRHALSRFAAYCSLNTIRPDEVNREVLGSFLVELQTSEIVKTPKDLVHNTISSWNRAAREVPGWPQITLSSPTAPLPNVLPLDLFPLDFQAELSAWEVRVSARPKGSSIFRDEGLLRPLRPETIKSQLFMFRQIGTALIKSGAMELHEITSLASLCRPGTLRVALEFEHERLGGNDRRVFEMAGKLAVLSTHFAGSSPEQTAELKRLCANRPKRENHITVKNQDRLTQFNDPANYALLTRIPAHAAKKARQTANRYRAAKLMEQAIAISILLRVAPRLATLRRLELSWFQRQPDNSLLLMIPATVMKSRRPLELALNSEFGALLDEHIKRFRPALPGASGPYLFPGEKSGPRSKNAMYELIVGAGRFVGLDVNPHLFRHLLQKVCVERDPSSLNDISKVLGHASISTTLTFYADRNGKAASQRLDGLLMPPVSDGEEVV